MVMGPVNGISSNAASKKAALKARGKQSRTKSKDRDGSDQHQLCLHMECPPEALPGVPYEGSGPADGLKFLEVSRTYKTCSLNHM